MPQTRHLRSRQATPEPSLAAPRPDSGGVTFTVSPAARAARRELGPVAWAVLEAVLGDAATEASGRTTALTSARRLAGALGTSKDTAARALARLVDAGLLVRHGGSRAGDGTFTTGSYEVLVDRIDGVTIESEPTGHAPPSVIAKVSRCGRGERDHQQPSLFELDEAAP
jgi:hypothetical protein